MNQLTAAEQETAITMTAEDRSTWEIYSDDPVMQRRFEKIGATLIRNASNGIGKFYSLPANQISLRNPSKPLSEERRAQMVAHMRSVRKTE